MSLRYVFRFCVNLHFSSLILLSLCLQKTGLTLNGFALKGPNGLRTLYTDFTGLSLQITRFDARGLDTVGGEVATIPRMRIGSLPRAEASIKTPGLVLATATSGA